MTPGSLAPAFVRIEYHSSFGPHVMIIPTNEAVSLTVPFASLEIQAWDSSNRNLDDMVNELVTAMLPRFPGSVEFDNYTFFSQPTPDDLPIPIGSTDLAGAGSATTPGWYKATQETIIFRDTASNIAKLVLLDFASGNNFEKYSNPVTIGVDVIATAFMDESNGWRSRKNFRPATFLKRTATLNEKLRRAYRMT